MMLPKRPRTMELEPLRITELRALVAARLAMVLALVFLPPSTVLTMLVLTARITVAVAAAAAASAVFFFLAAASWAAFSAAAASFSAAF